MQEVSTQGELGRQIYFTAPTNATQDPQLVADGDKLFLINAASPTGNTEAGIVQIITGSETTGAISAQQNSSNQAPTLQLSGESSITIQQDSEWSEEGWSASDPEDGDLSTNVNVTSPREIDTSKPGTYELTYSVEDSEGLSTSVTRTIEVTPHRTGDNYYLALDGSDDNDGSIDQPFATFDHAKDSLKPGDTLHIRGGTYYQQLEINGSAGPKGDKHNPITVKAHEGETVVVSGAPPISTSWVKDGNRWKTNVRQGSDDLGTNKRDISQLFLDDKLLTGARYPNLDHEWDQPDHSFWKTTRRANRQADSEEHSNYSIDGLDDIQGSVEGAVWYALGNGPMLVQGHQQGSDVVQTAQNPRAQTGRWSIGSGDGWLMGALPLLDADREWFFDKETGDLYLSLIHI